MKKQLSILSLISARGGGDAPPVVALSSGLKERGHKVTILCDETSQKMVREDHIPSVAVPNGLDQTTFFDEWRPGVADDPAGSNTQNPLVEWAELSHNYALEQISPLKPDLIISSLFCMGLADSLSKSLGIPWCFVNPSFYFGQNQIRTWEQDWYGSFVQWIARDCFWPLSEEADLVLHATDPEFDIQPSRLPENHHYTGFLLWEPNKKLPETINNDGEPWALVTVSTVPQGDEISLARTAAVVLGDFPVRTLITLPYKQAQEEIGTLPENVQVAGFVPHGLILEHAVLSISHAGHGIVSKSLYHGVPMVLLPWNRDQPGVADRAAKLGSAEIVRRENFNHGSIQAAISRVLNLTGYRERATQISARLKSANAVQKACQIIEEYLIG